MALSTAFYFLLASSALTLSPGPDNTFVVAQGLSRGRRAAVITGWGMCSGVSIHTMAAAFGVSALLYSSAYAFNILKYAGAAYLLYLAYKAIREQQVLSLKTVDSEVSSFELFRRGFIMNVINPKVALFFLAFLPQFVNRSAGHTVLQMLTLGAIFMVQATFFFTIIGFLSGSLGNLIVQRPGISKWFSWLTAGVFTSLGLRLALSER